MIYFGVYTFTLQASDGELTTTNEYIVTVVSAPALTALVSNVAAAKNGDALTFTATVSEAVTIAGGTPSLTLDVGGQPLTATYTGGSGSTSLTFTATTGAGNDNSVTVTAINLNGATIIGNTTGQALLTDALGQVVSNFIVQALRGEDITIYGDGSQTRSFCYADDLIEGFVRLMASSDSVTGPINLGNPVEFTIKELAEAVLTKVGGRSRLVFKPLPQDDPRQRRPDIARAQAELGWEPRVQLDAGLEKTIHYFKQFLQS